MAALAAAATTATALEPRFPLVAVVPATKTEFSVEGRSGQRAPAPRPRRAETDGASRLGAWPGAKQPAMSDTRESPVRAPSGEWLAAGAAAARRRGEAR